jgi:hypothetical protein
VFNRVVLTVVFQGKPRVLMDGLITTQEHQPGDEPGIATLTLTGEDVSLAMDQEEKVVEHPRLDEASIAYRIISDYGRYGMVPQVLSPAFIDRPSKDERTPVQRGTDMEYLQDLAKRHAYVFYVLPGPAQSTNMAYWGPRIRRGPRQAPLSVNMGPHSNVDSIRFDHNALAPTVVYGRIQDRRTNQVRPVQASESDRSSLADQPTLDEYRDHVRRRLLCRPALTETQAYARARAEVDRSTDKVVTASGELDAVRYGDLLRARERVGLRGAGQLYDGEYYVQRVTHTLRRGSYRQSFTLTREGLGTTIPVV